MVSVRRCTTLFATLFGFAFVCTMIGMASYSLMEPAGSIPPRHMVNQNLKLPKEVQFTSDSRLSHIDFKLLADHLIGDYYVPWSFRRRINRVRRCSWGTCKGFKSALVRDGAVIYVEPGGLRMFVNDVLPYIDSRFTLITGDGDLCLPNCVLKEPREVKAIASNPMLVKWYATNCNGWNLSNKIQCIPIGLDQHSSARKDMQAMYDAGYGLTHGLVQPHKKLTERYVLVSFSIPSNPAERQPAYNHFCAENATQALRAVSNCFYKRGISTKQFYTQAIVPAAFVVSPPGAGLDCYRTWEALYLGAYPIVKSSSLDPVYEGLPVLIVKQWEDVTVELLEKTFQDFQKRDFAYDKLYMDYWREKIFN